MADEVGGQALEPKRAPPQDFYKIKNLHAIDFCGLSSDHHNLIRATFLNSLRIGNDWFKLIDQNAYYKKYATFIEDLIARSTIRYGELDDETIIGWCMHQRGIVHYVWVKKEAHRKGVATSLMPKEFNTMTHVTHKVLNIWAKKFPEVKFDPFY